MKETYRQGVAAVILSDDRQVLMGEIDPGVGLHFPQGGMERGETEEETLWRELLEELGTNQFQLLAKSRNRWRYAFPLELRLALKTHYLGQEHRYFLLRLRDVAQKSSIRPDPQEFRSIQWVPYEDVLQICVAFKREVYYHVLDEFRSIVET
jgi:putative (di)nucleoside polyphosphate hydrolase